MISLINFPNYLRFMKVNDNKSSSYIPSVLERGKAFNYFYYFSLVHAFLCLPSTFLSLSAKCCGDHGDFSFLTSRALRVNVEVRELVASHSARRGRKPP